MHWKAVKRFSKGLYSRQRSYRNISVTPWAPLTGDKSPPADCAMSPAGPHCRTPGRPGQAAGAGSILCACPHACSLSPALPLPGAGSRCPFPWLAWVHLASDPLWIFVLIFRCYLVTCHFTCWWQGQSCLGDPLSGGRSPHCFLKDAALLPSLPIPWAIFPSRQGILLPHTHTWRKLSFVFTVMFLKSIQSRGSPGMTLPLHSATLTLCN